MSLGLAPAGGPGKPGPTAPTHRPRWLLMLSSITLLYGGVLLVSGLTALSDPAAVGKFAVTRPMAPEEESLIRELTLVNGEIAARHSRAIRARALASMLVAMVMLYSAAAALSRDRHGRRATLIAAWLGIAYQVGTLPLAIPMTSEFAAANAPLLFRMAALSASADDATGTPTATPGATGGAPAAVAAPAKPSQPPLGREEMASIAQTAVLRVLLAVTLLGVLGSLLQIVYFGGRRGRELYGLPPRR